MRNAARIERFWSGVALGSTCCAVGLWLSCLTACHWGDGARNGNAARVALAPDDFYRPGGDNTTTQESRSAGEGSESMSTLPPSEPQPKVAGDAHDSPESASGGQAASGDAGAAGGNLMPAASDMTRPMPTTGLLVGGLIGQINGRPIYVEDFFAPLASELANKGRMMSRPEFARAAKILIEDRLIQMIRSELLLSEAESSLTEEQRMGLLYWLKKKREDVVRQSGGYEGAAQGRALQQSGVGLDEMLQTEKENELVQAKLREEIVSRIHVSSRDVARYYRTHPEEFDPPAGIQLRLIFVPVSDQDTIDAVNRELAAGVPFEAVAGKYSVAYAAQGGLWDPTVLPEGLEKSSPTGAWPEVDRVVRTLSQGEYGGPVTVGSNAIWPYVEMYDDGRARSLYEVQHEITDKLFRKRFDEEQARYFDRLMKRSSIDNPEPMLIELVRIALERWGKPTDGAEDGGLLGG